MNRNKVLTRIVAGLLTICFSSGVFSERVFADSNTMTVSPPYQKIILVPGETYKNAISVFNSTNSTRDLKYAVEVGSFSQHADEGSNDDYGSVDHVSVSSYNQIVDWIKIDKDRGTLPPGEATEVTYSIEVPEDAPAGGQYATILVIDETTSGVPGEENIAIDQKFQFASIIYAEVAGETREEGAILGNSMPSFLLSGGFEATSMVRNNGNVHTDAEYTLQIWPLFSDEEIYTNEEEPETSLILPGTERYHAQHRDLPAIGIFRAKQTVKIFGETSIVEKTVIVCPLWLLFIILFAIIALVLWVFMRVKGGRSRRNSSEDE